MLAVKSLEEMTFDELQAFRKRLMAMIARKAAPTRRSEGMSSYSRRNMSQTRVTLARKSWRSPQG